MKRTFTLVAMLIGGVSATHAQSINCDGSEKHISCFASVGHFDQSDTMEIPATHTFQILLKEGDAYADISNGTAPGNNDFTGYVGKNGSSIEGYVAVNHENSPGGVSIVDVSYDPAIKSWGQDLLRSVDFTGVVATQRNCSGGITPWGTIITSEESVLGFDANGDGYNDIGWQIEIDPVTASIATTNELGLPQKLWALGTMSHENIVVANDSITAYEAEDGGSGAVYKFVADNKMDLTSGKLYALKLDLGLENNEPVSPKGVWVEVPNETASERNSTNSLAIDLGATDFGGAEDVEINPVTGEIYFTSKSAGRTFAFTDGGDSITNFRTFVGGKEYPIQMKDSVEMVSWGGGNDNLTFDQFGNLYVLQDGGTNYIWYVSAEHTQENPDVKIFMRSPNGSEPTGMTFSPDYRFMFLSIQHPSSANATQQDAFGNDVALNASATIVIARNEHLGSHVPGVQVASLDAELQECANVGVTMEKGNGSHRLLIAKEGSPVDAEPADVTAYSDSSHFGLGEDLGNGNFVMYAGADTFVELSGFTSGKEYFFKAFEYNNKGGLGFYNLTDAPINQIAIPEQDLLQIFGSSEVNKGDEELYTVESTNGKRSVFYNWVVEGGQIVEGDSLSEILVQWDTTGLVQVVERDSTGCLSEPFVLPVTVLENSTAVANGQVLKLKVYPNPASDVVNLGIEITTSSRLQVLDVRGTVLMDQIISENQINTSGLLPGNYFFVLTQANKSFVSQVLIKR